MVRDALDEALNEGTDSEETVVILEELQKEDLAYDERQSRLLHQLARWGEDSAKTEWTPGQPLT